MNLDNLNNLYNVVIRESEVLIKCYSPDKQTIYNVKATVTPAKSTYDLSQTNIMLTNTTTINLLTQFNLSLLNFSFIYNNKWYKIKTKKTNSISKTTTESNNLWFHRYTAMSTEGDL